MEIRNASDSNRFTRRLRYIALSGLGNKMGDEKCGARYLRTLGVCRPPEEAAVGLFKGKGLGLSRWWLIGTHNTADSVGYSSDVNGAKLRRPE
jgi:hypothetical protein